jgi:hypothetical protein
MLLPSTSHAASQDISAFMEREILLQYNLVNSKFKEPEVF